MTYRARKCRSGMLIGMALLSSCALSAVKIAAAAAAGTQEQQIHSLQKALKDVLARLDQLADQNQQLMKRQEQLQAQVSQQQLALQRTARAQPPETVSALPDQSAAQTAAAAPASSPASAVPSPATSTAGTGGLPGAQPGGFGLAALSNVRLWGYGEIYYNRPTHEPNRTQVDLARAVFGIGYHFDDRTEFNSEYEVEHAVASASDPGEFEVEQFYIDRELTDRVGLRAGLFLMPFGLLNEHHEPTNFYGVQRNFVETLIIPSTWREGGLSLHGDTELGLSWSAGLTTGVDLSKWQFAPEFPQYTTALQLEDNDVAPLQASHQELALANGRHLSQYLAVNYFGVPGLDVGGAITTGKAVPVPGSPGDPRVALWEGHARWTPGRFDLSGVYAQGTISDVAAANRANPGSPNPIPSAFYGYFLQAAYGLWERGEYRLNPFVRWEHYDMGSRYSGAAPVIPTGSVPLSDSPGDFGLWPLGRDRVWTVGANFYVTPHLVFKADYQWFDVNTEFDRFDLGLGLNF
ncbi:MAG TPA: porin [Steroidobacteraceae bacterium]|nr:porin [Steroidobacteraceae bacterium]